MSYTNPSNNVYPRLAAWDGKYTPAGYYVNPNSDGAAGHRRHVIPVMAPTLQYNSGDTTHTFDPSKPFFKTISGDGGGADTISLSNYTPESTPSTSPPAATPPCALPCPAIPAAPPPPTTAATPWHCLRRHHRNAIGGSGDDTPDWQQRQQPADWRQRHRRGFTATLPITPSAIRPAYSPLPTKPATATAPTPSAASKP